MAIENRKMLENDLILDEIVRRLVATFHPERIYLFGSKARGDSNPDSDYDLMIVVPDETPRERRKSRLAYQVLQGLAWQPMSPSGPGRPSMGDCILPLRFLPRSLVKGNYCMPHDPALSAETREWLKKAASDLSCAKHALTASPPLLGDVVYP